MRAEAGGACARWAAHGGGWRRVEAAADGLREGETAPFLLYALTPSLFPSLALASATKWGCDDFEEEEFKVREFPFNPTFL